MRGALALALLAACGSQANDQPAPAAEAHADVVVAGGKLVAGGVEIALSDDPLAQAGALKKALAAQAHLPHPVLQISSDARADAVVVAIFALEGGDAAHVDVRTRDPGDRRVCDLERPTGAATGDTAVTLSVLVTPDAVWFAQSRIGDIRQVSAKRADLDAAVKEIGGSAPFAGRRDAEIAASPGVSAAELMAVISALCPRFPALEPTSPDGLTARPTM